MYVDDVLFESEDPSSIRHLRNQINSLLNCGGFELRKWASNSSELLSDIDSDNHGLACQRTLHKDEKLKILGIGWHPLSDCFQYNVALSNHPPLTKRLILSAIAKLFDPLGWVTPATVNAKIFIQSLWRLNLDWDSDIPVTLQPYWSEMYSQLTSLNDVRIPRWTFHDTRTIRQEFHGFADAFLVAYAAVVYLKIVSESGQVHISLLVGKSKVAPVKSLTIPRLELFAAVLLSRLIKFVRESITLDDSQCHCWTDSTIVFSWLQRHASWKTFVANRVATIHSNVSNISWRHVPSADNPADCASRGLLSNELVNFQLWWSGPAWLTRDSDFWPNDNLGDKISDDISELRSTHIHVAVSPSPWTLTEQFSSWPRLIRVTAYLFKFISYCRAARSHSNSSSVNSLSLTSAECQLAKTYWLKTIQRELFLNEIMALINNSALSHKSSILSLNPFLDPDGLLRVGGRLSNAPLLFSVKHPIVLAAHGIVTLIIRHAYHRRLHAGLTLTLSMLRQEY